MSAFHFLTFKNALTANSKHHNKQNTLKLDTLNYTMMLIVDSLVLFLTGDESQNLHVKLVKNQIFVLNCAEPWA